MFDTCLHFHHAPNSAQYTCLYLESMFCLNCSLVIGTGNVICEVPMVLHMRGPVHVILRMRYFFLVNGSAKVQWVLICLGVGGASSKRKATDVRAF